ncbi:MAG TPA: FAD-dependent oxidoreductase [Acidimicrobiales bacterium]|nr:FAD-dependent oxidoreductase [Acidimicrobiales bacterium]
MGEPNRRAPAGTVIVGASVAGVRAAQALRREGYDRPVVVVGDEPEQPYDRPPLSKQYLSGPMDADGLLLLSAERAERDGIELRLGLPAAGLDPAAREVVLADGTVLGYEHCIIATGASARPSPWDTRSGVYLLRTRRDSDELARALARHRRVAIVGGGFIGAEVASTAAAKGCEVVVIDPLPNPLARIVGDALGQRLAGLHARHGVETRFGVGAESLTGAEGDLTVGLTSGEAVHADVAVVGIGAVCNDGWLAGSGVPLDDGVVCDEFCAVEGLDSVWACGDVARWYHRRHRALVRVEHWTNAVEQAACVAHNIVAEQPRAYEPVEYVWSDQYDVRLQIVGRPGSATCEDTIGDTSGRPERMAVLYGDDSGTLTGAATLNWPRALVECRRLLATGAAMDAARQVLSGLRVPALG